MRYLILAFAFLAVCYAAQQRYTVQVLLTNDRFEPVNGTLKIFVGKNQYQKDHYRLNETVLATGRSYTSPIYMPNYIHEVNNVTFYWTLSSPIPPKYLWSKPSIHLRGVKIIPSYIQNPQFRLQEQRSFCPPKNKLKHKEEAKLFRCNL